MKRLTISLLMSSLLFGGLATLTAQEKSAGPMGPPKVLNIVREFTKPGKGGAAHEKTEGAFVKAMREAKWPTHYLAMDSVSGKPRSLFFTAYDSFEAIEKDALATEKKPAFAAALDRANAADGELLTETDISDFVYREDLSLRAHSDIPHMRYFEIIAFKIRPGHDHDWETLAKMYVAGYEKIPSGHWATYEAVFGQEGSVFIAIIPHKSAAEIDSAFADEKPFADAVGEQGMKKIEELSAAAIETSHSSLFAFNPRMSYVSEDWIKADPEFWNPKPAKEPAAAKEKKEKEAKSETKK